MLTDIDHDAIVCTATLNMSLLQRRSARVMQAHLQMVKRRVEDERAAPTPAFGSRFVDSAREPAFDFIRCATPNCKGMTTVSAGQDMTSVLCARCNDQVMKDSGKQKRLMRPQFRMAAQVVSRITPEELERLEKEMSPW